MESTNLALQCVIGGIKHLVTQLRVAPAPENPQPQICEEASARGQLEVLLRYLDH